MLHAACGEFGPLINQGLKVWGRNGGSWRSMSDKADPDPEVPTVLKCISVKKIARTATPNSQRTPGFTTTEKSGLPENIT
jgi:hypothetical protein